MANFVNLQCGRCKEDLGEVPEQGCYLCYFAKRESERNRARPIEQWDEDDGAVLWWRFPIEEPPYSGTPNDDDWPGYHTHWTTVICPDNPSEET